MSKSLSTEQEVKSSKAIARCLITAVASLVFTFLLWKTILVFSSEVPVSFHMTCVLVAVVTILASTTAIYRIQNPAPVVARVAQTPVAVRRRVRPNASVSETLVMPSLFSTGNDVVWFQKN